MKIRADDPRDANIKDKKSGRSQEEKGVQSVLRNLTRGG